MSTRGKKLREGFTTGTAAAAAAKAALTALFDCQWPSAVTIPFLSRGEVTIPVHSLSKETDTTAVCTVRKDAGDDPDVTHRAEIGARVTILENQGKDSEAVTIRGGRGVGRVTKPGLEIPPGRAAINPGPCKMIRQAVGEVLQRFHRPSASVRVEVFVPRGEEMAARTLNARLGIVGGISILGTTGIERPMSHEAYVATIHSALSVARACGQRTVVMTTGRRSERHAQNLLPDLSEEAFVQMGDFFQEGLQSASETGVDTIVIVAFFGKALKMARRVPQTHASRSAMNLTDLSRWALESGFSKKTADAILSANTARHAFDIILQEGCQELIAVVGQRVKSAAEVFVGGRAAVRVLLLDYDGKTAFDSRLSKPQAV